jgi:hypothetical protein
MMLLRSQSAIFSDPASGLLLSTLQGIDLPGDVTAGGVSASTTDAAGPAGQPFYRVLLLP